MRNRTGKDGFCGSCPCAGGCHRPRGSCARRQRPAHALAPIGAVCQSMGNAPENSKASANGRKRNGGEVGREGNAQNPAVRGRYARLINRLIALPWAACFPGRYGALRSGGSVLGVSAADSPRSFLPLRPFGTPAGPWTDAAFACISCGRA